MQTTLDVKPQTSRPETFERPAIREAPWRLGSLDQLAPRPWGRRVAAVLAALVAVVAGCLVLIPWQQSVGGKGKVIVYSAMERPQSIEAQIPGRLLHWNVEEGQAVQEGQVIAQLSDLDAKFLSGNQLEQLEQQRSALTARRAAAQARATSLEEQIRALDRSREIALPTADERARQAELRLHAAEEALNAARQSEQVSSDAALPVASARARQAMERERAAREALAAAEQNLKAAREVGIPSAEEKVRQAEDRKRAADQGLLAARQQLETARLKQRRSRELLQRGYRARQDDELVTLEYVKAKTDVERAEAALSVAVRDISVAALDREKARVDLARAQTEVERAAAGLEVAREDTQVGGLDRTRAGIELERAGTEVERARAAVEIARRDARVGNLDRVKVDADTAATLSSAEASYSAARETIAAVESEIRKLEVEIENLRRRVEQRTVRAPRAGRIVRLMKVGAGETVDQGDVLAVLAPETSDQAVELFLSDNDAPLVRVGRPVRLQFAGWPALQFTGWPSAAVGTFAGRVAVMDAVDDGSGRFRIIVQPDQAAIRAGKEEAWPAPQALRPGAAATGWVMLDTVPLGWELWRQFNAFPPTLREAPADTKEKAAGDKSEGEIKRKKKE